VSLYRVQKITARYDSTVPRPEITTGNAGVDEFLERDVPVLIADFVALNAQAEAAKRILSSVARFAGENPSSMVDGDLVDAATRIAESLRWHYTRYDGALEQVFLLKQEVERLSKQVEEPSTPSPTGSKGKKGRRG